MKQFLPRLTSLIFGLLLYAVGVVVTINANIGYGPWEVFHAGIANATGITIGTASIAVGIVIVVIVALLGEKLGLGTLLNILLIGLFMDAILMLGVIPTAGNYFVGIIMLITGLFIIATGSFFYIKAAFGAGPRDSLMVAFRRRTNIPVGVCRAVIEFTAVIIGWLLGGMFGLGTILSVVAMGFCIQITFKVLRFDVTAVKHQTFRTPQIDQQSPEEEAEDTVA